MNIPPPQAKLAGCVWLARILAKARLLTADKLEPAYAERFCHPTGVDNQFLSFFLLTKENILEASSGSDSEVADWFLSLPSTAGGRIEKWNHIALNMGRPGFPLAERLPIALSTSYQHLQHLHLQTIFEVLEADDKISAPPS